MWCPRWPPSSPILTIFSGFLPKTYDLPNHFVCLIFFALVEINKTHRNALKKNLFHSMLGHVTNFLSYFVNVHGRISIIKR